MFSISRTFIRLPDKLVEVKRHYPEGQCKDVDAIKEWLEADTLLRKDGRLYFCVTVQEAEILEETTLELPTKESSEISED